MSRQPRRGAQNSRLGKQLGLAARYQPKSPDASPEQLRRLTGVIALTVPLPPADLFDEGNYSGTSPGAGRTRPSQA